MNLACVIHRYGPDIAGGSETHCRQLAERLARTHRVTVLTSCARDYVSWRNSYPQGRSESGGVTLIRFPAARRRNLGRFFEISDRVFSSAGSRGEEEQWFRENGPDLPGLLHHLREHGRTYDRILFWCYRYAPSFFGLPLVADRAILVPTAEEDPAINLEVLGRYFTLARGYLFLTPEERGLVASRSAGELPPFETIGSGLDPAPARPGTAVLDGLGLERPFALYLGRVERNKGCETLLRFYDQHLARGGCSVPLVMAGPILMPLPAHGSIRPLGFVGEAIREALLAEARVLIVPSPYESLSLVLLEAWNHGVPALVNGRCKVLEGQVRRANGGLHYRSAGEFSESLSWFVDHADEARTLGAQGRAMIEREYRWPTVLARVERLLGASSRSS